MSKFAVGEVAVVSFSCMTAFPVGTEVTILAVPVHSLSPSHQYLIYDGPVDQVFACDRCLRKKPPPGVVRQPLGKWSECPWRPGVVHSAEEMSRRIKHGFAELDRCIKRGLEQS